VKRGLKVEKGRRVMICGDTSKRMGGQYARDRRGLKPGE